MIKKCIDCKIVSITIFAKTGRCKRCHTLKLNKSRIGIPTNVASKNGMWRGDNVSYKALHTWVRKYKPCNGKCEKCQQVKPLDLANKGVYDRDFSNWEWLCRRCHMLSDGRMSQLKQYATTK